MAEVKDIEIAEGTNDIVVSSGDISVIKSDQQHVEHILRSDRGHWRQWPLVGMGIDQYMNGPINTAEIKRLITLHLTSDGYNVNQVLVDDAGQIDIDAQRVI